MTCFLFWVTKSFFLSFVIDFPNPFLLLKLRKSSLKNLSSKGWLPNPWVFSELFIMEVLRVFDAICASIFLSSDFSSFFFFSALRCQPSQPVPLFSAKRKKKERERNTMNTKIRIFFFSVSGTSTVHFHWVFYKNLFLSSLTIEKPQENLWSISRKQRPWQAMEQLNPTVGRLGRNPSLSTPKNNTVC